MNNNNNNNSKKNKSWIIENSEEPLDLLDVKSIKNVVSTDPNRRKRQQQHRKQNKGTTRTQQ